MCVFTKQKEIKNKNTALIWNPCPLSNYLLKKFNWTPILNWEKFESTDFNQFDEVFIFAEMSWDNMGYNKMLGIKLMVKLLLQIDLSKTKLHLLSFYSNRFLENCVPDSYKLSLLLSKSEYSFFDKLNVWDINKFQNQPIRKLLGYQFHCINHNTNVEGLIDTAIFQLDSAKVKMDRSPKSASHFLWNDNDLFSKLEQIENNYTEIIKSLRYNENYEYRTIVENHKLHSVVKYIRDLRNYKGKFLSKKTIKKIIEKLTQLGYHFEEMRI